jgi:hemin uptake protein HemP
MSVWTENAARFATTPDQALAARERAGRRTALEHLVKRSDRDACYRELVRSVESQNRIAGNGNIAVRRDGETYR